MIAAESASQRWQPFLKTFFASPNSLGGSTAGGTELDAIIAQERLAMDEHLERAFKNILANFDPKLIPFKKKRKIIVADSALKDLF